MNGPVHLRKPVWLWLGLCVAIFAPRAYLAVHDQGVIWADEIFQTIEQGHRLAFGYGLVPWEFQSGARSWFLPGALGGFMKLLAKLGLDQGLGLVVGIKLLFAVGAAIAFYPMLRLAQVMAGAAASLLLGIVAIAFPASLLYSSRALAEVACAPLIAWSLWFLWPCGLASGARAPDDKVGGARVWRLLGAGVLFGLATVLRCQNGALLAALVLIVLARCRLRAAITLAAGGFAALILGGLLDWVTWGKPFQSTIEYLRFNVIEKGSELWGVSSRGFYLQTMLATNGLALLALVLGFLAGLARTWPVALLSLLFLAIHSVFPHKEFRFLYPALPLFLACAAVGLAILIERLPGLRVRPVASAAVVGLVLLAAFGLRARRVTFEDIGQGFQVPGEISPPTTSVWGCLDEQNRLLAEVGRRADLCGLVMPNVNAYWTGGYSYLHRRVPILWWPGLDSANYALLIPGQKLSDGRYKMVAQASGYALSRRDGPCRPVRGPLGSYGRLVPAGVP
ncbi:MAG: hypothetical protein WCG85_07525 [Polyangia bacterium]